MENRKIVDKLVDHIVPYEKVIVELRNRINVYIVNGNVYNNEEFGTQLLKCNWKSFRQSISTIPGYEKKSVYASDRLWLARRGYKRISKCYHRGDLHICAGDVLTATGKSRNWVYKRCALWEKGGLTCDELFSPFKIDEDGENDGDWGHLTNKDRSYRIDEIPVGTWEKDHYGDVELPDVPLVSGQVINRLIQNIGYDLS